MVECVRVRHSSMDSPVLRREDPRPLRLRHMRREKTHSFLRLGRLASSCSFFVSVFVFLGFLLAVAAGYPQAPAVGESVVPRLIDDDAGMASANALDTPSAGVTYPSRASEATRGQDAQILYIPFFMAESLPASMNTRDPAIISVSGCPRGHYRSHTGNCRKNFHYTINPLIHNSYSNRQSAFEASTAFLRAQSNIPRKAPPRPYGRDLLAAASSLASSKAMSSSPSSSSSSSSSSTSSVKTRSTPPVYELPSNRPPSLRELILYAARYGHLRRKPKGRRDSTFSSEQFEVSSSTSSTTTTTSTSTTTPSPPSTTTDHDD